LLDLFRLPQMAAIVRRNDEETGGDAESDEREERILEPRAVRVDDRRVADQLTSEIVSGVIVVQYRLSVLRWSWFCLAWRAQAASDRRLHRLGELPAEITWPCRFPAPRAAALRGLDPSPDRGPIYAVDHAEVIEALRDAPPAAVSRTPVKLFIAA